MSIRNALPSSSSTFIIWLFSVAILVVASVQSTPVVNSRNRRALLNNDGPLNHQLYFHEIKPASHMEAFSHESVTLTCQAGGSPPPTIHWLKNGQALGQSSLESTEQILEDLSTSTNSNDEDASSDGLTIGLSSTRSRLFLDCLQAKDSAVYTCVAETPYSRISTDTKLVVTDAAHKLGMGGGECIEKRSAGFGKPARITMWTDTRMELTGADVKLFCRASGSPAPQITWERAEDGQIIHNDPRHKILPNGDLIIKKVSWEEDMGRFICVAQNNLGMDTAKMFLYPTPGL